MFYKRFDRSKAIKQGDIFTDLPFVEFDLEKIFTINNLGNVSQEQKWEAIKQTLTDVRVALKVVNTSAIVISQDCDNSRNDFISFAKISSFTEVTGKSPTNPKNWIEEITKGPAKSRYHWFYLPENPTYQIAKKYAVDLDVIFQLPKDSVLSRRNQQCLASLGSEALQHFRETLVRYFTRYAHNEWYSFTKEEFNTYKATVMAKDPQEAAMINPYPHQR